MSWVRVILVVASACGRVGFDLRPTDATDAAVAAPNLCGDTSGLQAGAPWPVIHGCPTNAGRSPVVGPASGATLITPRGNNVAPRGAAVGAGNQIYVQEYTMGQVFAFDGGSGGLAWTFTGAFSSGYEPFPVIDDRDRIFATTAYGMLFCIDPSTGVTAWNLQLAGSFSSPVIAARGTIFFGAGGPYGFYAVDAEARTQKWHYDVPNSGDATTAPAIGDGMVYFADTKNSRLFALDAASGEHVFDVAVPGTAVGSPVLGIDTLYVATMTNGVAAFDARTGALAWQEPAAQAVVQPALLANGDLVSSTTTGFAFVLDRATGAVRSGWPLGGNVLAPPVIDLNDTTYFATDRGTIAYTIAPSLQWESPLTGPIVIADHAIVVLPATQTVAAIGP